jgi:DNA-binding protein HU-beta
LTKTNDGGFQFSVYGPTGRIIVTSETYRSKPTALNAIETLRKAASKAVIDDQTPGRASSPNTPKAVAKTARAAGRAVGKAKAAAKEVLDPAKKKPTGQANGRATSATKRPAAKKTTAKAAPTRKTAAKARPRKAAVKTTAATRRSGR